MPHPPAPFVPRVAVLCPTFGRPARHALLHRAFAHQTHPAARRTLYVLDDGPGGPSPYFARGSGDAYPGVKYAHAAARRTVGAKRNALVAWALADPDGPAPDAFAHFDDDDYYAPGYLARLLGLLYDGEGADLATLGAWTALREADGSFWRADPHAVPTAAAPAFELRGDGSTWRADPRAVARARDANLWGYGFSYAWRADALARLPDAARPFPDVAHGEDWAFARALARAGGRLLALDDEEGLALHALHAGSSSSVIAAGRVPGAAARAALGSAADPWLRAAGLPATDGAAARPPAAPRPAAAPPAPAPRLTRGPVFPPPDPRPG